ncbi:M14 family metallopeptidase [Flavobacterium sp. NRK F10]|uniref:M14 family metallopeptidase n=1 Tax=Flavobacterium sp. NRK F10 TaxID=2954931 RepID=UPI002090A8C7|nr:M14 family metallopeptidase [Flavobacterium sp. NRK F10]MCO6176109.1 M14 family metallopeptidase [Flavobacterium sp. NRK F10]
MRIYFYIALLNFTFSLAQNNLQTPFEKGNGNQSTTYEECINYYQNLEHQFETIQIREMGLTDCGESLRIVCFSKDKNFDFNSEKAVVLINNGIHPGEPDGIDATMMLMHDLATAKIKVPEHTIVVAIPVYNIGGMLNRNSHSRANQNGPEEYGFRGNARNYDLNRDFIKSDSRNSRSFQEIFHQVNPDMFIDNHVSNGADYQYTFTCIATQHQRLGGALGTFYKEEMHPAIMAQLKKKKIESVPYVNIHGDMPDNGFAQFMDTPRYATGYTTLFNTLGSVPETHMLKPFKERVAVTYQYMVETIQYVDENRQKIKKLREDNLTNYKAGKEYPLQWQLDSTKVSSIEFKGYKGGYKPSAVSGNDRLYYDRKQPFTKEIPFYADYKGTKTIIIPRFYIVPQSQWPVVELLKLNGIKMQPLAEDTEIEVESYSITSFETSKYPYEGHYGHYNTTVTSKTEKLKLRKGDFMIDTQQKGVKFLLETLEPEAVDSYFNWNFFDPILQQKEYFSAYVFEDLAKDLLDSDPELKEEFEAKKKADEKFAASSSAQLDWVYTHSDYYEKAHRHYPVYRIK